ncbi:MAG: DUF433 domain-containing protein [Anaerolineae bacterium]|nr:DUF433 domain-containing protein [Anaerolineae bacterium]
MTLNIQTDAPPLRFTKDGVVMVGKTRVPLETVIYMFREGASAEQVVESFDVLALADVYAVFSYYLNHRDDVDAYMRASEADAERVRREIEARQPDMFSLRERLLARKAARKQE